MPRISTQAGGKKKKAYSTPFSVMKLTKYIIHSKSAILRWIYALYITSCLLSDAGACDAYSQPGRQSVVQTKWFGLVGSRGADNGRSVWLKCLWCQWLCQQLRLADPKWRSAESPAGACHGLNRAVLIFFFLEAAFLRGFIWELGGFRSCGESSAALLRLICWHFVCFKEVKGARGKKGKESEHVGEVQIESEGLSFVFFLLEVQFGVPRGGVEMFKSSKSPVSDCKKLREEKEREIKYSILKCVIVCFFTYI